MGDTFILIAGYLFAFFLGLGWFLRTRSLTKIILDLQKECSQQQDEAEAWKHKYQRELKSAKAAKTSFDQSNSKVAALKKQQYEAIKKYKQEEERFREKEQLFMDVQETHQAKVRELEEGIREVLDEKKQLAQKLGDAEKLLAQREKREQDRVQSQALHDKLQGSQEEVKRLAREKGKLEERFGKLQGILKDQAYLKRQLSHYQLLYRNSKGHQELAEERQRNWEVALRNLSGWVLQNSGKEIPEDGGLAVCVTSAMDAINQPLVEDEFSRGQQHQPKRVPDKIAEAES